MRSILSADDLSDADVRSILEDAAELRGRPFRPEARASRLLGLLFLEPSLRTRVGFAAASARLGWESVEVQSRRESPVSAQEGWRETVRVLSGYCDAVVARPGKPLRLVDGDVAATCALVNGGDTGPIAEHPTQALVDIFAIQQLAGPVDQMRLAVVGDPRMRGARSLLRLLARNPPAGLTVIAAPSHLGALELPAQLDANALRTSDWSAAAESDVVYVAGIPHESIPLRDRDRLRVTQDRMNALPPRCIVLSPMPVIDEIDDHMRSDKRNRMLEQSDLGVYVRMAVLRHLVEESGQDATQ